MNEGAGAVGRSLRGVPGRRLGSHMRCATVAAIGAVCVRAAILTYGLGPCAERVALHVPGRSPAAPGQVPGSHPHMETHSPQEPLF